MRPSLRSLQEQRENSVQSTALDDIDFRIINALVRNGRTPFASLGAEDRVRRLQRAGIITGFTATVDLGTVGRGLDAFIDVRLLAGTQPDAFEAFVKDLPAVREVAFVTGRFDYHVRVACRDADDLDATVRAIRGEAGAAQTETRIVLRASASPMGLAR
jgi:Lrp/AsnC family transcriptional regulator, leucine-responsive regulatory protein